jgi:hypothetical protein
MGDSLSLTAAHSRAPSAFVFGDRGGGLHHLSHLPHTGPFAATCAIAVSATSASSASVSGVGR